MSTYGYLTKEEVEEYLGIGYQTFRKDLKPDQFDYTGSRGIPRNLYSHALVEKYKDEHFDKNGKHIPAKHTHNFNKDKYTGHDVRLKLGDKYYEILKKKLPTMEVKEGGRRIVNYYNKRLIDTISKIKFTAELLQAFVDNCKEVQFDYSGRYMFGSNCIGFIVDNDYDFIRKVMRDLDELGMIEFHKYIFDIQSDDFGLNKIVYVQNCYRIN